MRTAAILAAAVLGSTPSAASEPPLRVVVLGSGTPAPSRTQAGTAILVQAGNDNLLFDCGRGCTTRLGQYEPRLLPRIDRLFLTHLHSDHVVGIPDLWLNGWTQGRNAPLRIWGPAGTGQMMDGLRQAYAADLSYRLSDGVPASDAGLRPAVTIVRRDGVVYRNGDLTVTAFAVRHGGIPAFGYRIDRGALSVLISGDTTATPNLARHGKDVDVALLEVASPMMADYVRRSFAPRQAEQILSFHPSVDMAAAAFAAIKPRLGVYYHTVSGDAADAALIDATAGAYSGRVEVSRDLMEIAIQPDRVVVSHGGEGRRTAFTADAPPDQDRP
jgi:ribonuclease Z